MVTSAQSRMAAQGNQFVVSVLGATVSTFNADAGTSPSRRSVVVQATIGAQEVDILVRFHQRDGITYVDLVMDSSIANLTSRVTALALAAVWGNHAAPVKDNVDASAMVAAGGS